MRKVGIALAAALTLVLAACSSSPAPQETREAAGDQTATVTFNGGTLKFPKGDPQAMDALAPMTATNTGGSNWSIQDFEWPCVSEKVSIGTVYVQSSATAVTMTWASGSPEQTTFSTDVSVTVSTDKPAGKTCTPVAKSGLSLRKADLAGVENGSTVTIAISGLKVSYVKSSGSDYSLANSKVSIPKATGSVLLATVINALYGLPGTGAVTADLTITSP
ncbi:MAG: hypothetical protein U0990_06140 [Candidatus Nanopelagicales bacterium]|nr:hypothetical protein [Candidatus Nanopelagicales bacterium]MDZ4249653.1 hypothetical protein [Candidatus Nanopelagicales bacterium]